MSLYAEGGTWDGKVVPASRKWESYSQLTLPPYSAEAKPSKRADGLISETYRRTGRYKNGLLVYVFERKQCVPVQHDRILSSPITMQS